MKTSICQNCNKEFNVGCGAKGKYCSLSCQMIDRNRALREKQILDYLKSPSFCKHCGKELSFLKKKMNHCSRSCAASNSVRLPHSEETKEKIRQYHARKLRINKVKNCIICQKEIVNQKRKTCSDICCSKQKSIKAKEAVKTRIFGGSTTKNKFPFIKKNGNVVYLDSSWEQILAEALDQNNIVWERPSFFRLSNGKRYTPDFYLPDYSLYLDPKAKAREERFNKSLEKIALFEKEYNVRCLVIDNKNNLNWQFIMSAIRAGLIQR